MALNNLYRLMERHQPSPVLRFNDKKETNPTKLQNNSTKGLETGSEKTVRVLSLSLDTEENALKHPSFCSKNKSKSQNYADTKLYGNYSSQRAASKQKITKEQTVDSLARRYRLKATEYIKLVSKPPTIPTLDVEDIQEADIEESLNSKYIIPEDVVDVQQLQTNYILQEEKRSANLERGHLQQIKNAKAENMSPCKTFINTVIDGKNITSMIKDDNFESLPDVKNMKSGEYPVINISKNDLYSDSLMSQADSTVNNRDIYRRYQRIVTTKQKEHKVNKESRSSSRSSSYVNLSQEYLQQYQHGDREWLKSSLPKILAGSSATVALRLALAAGVYSPKNKSLKHLKGKRKVSTKETLATDLQIDSQVDFNKKATLNLTHRPRTTTNVFRMDSEQYPNRTFNNGFNLAESVYSSIDKK